MIVKAEHQVIAIEASAHYLLGLQMAGPLLLQTHCSLSLLHLQSPSIKRQPPKPSHIDCDDSIWLKANSQWFSASRQINPVSDFAKIQFAETAQA